MTKFKPYWFYSFGYYVQPLLYLRAELPHEVQVRLLTHAGIGLELFTSDEQYVTMLPKSIASAKLLLEQINIWTGLKQDEFGRRTAADIPGLRDWVKSFSKTLEIELDSLHAYCVTENLGLDIDALVCGYHVAYPPETLALFDDFIKREIDESGQCLAFARPTATGFHILRAMEIMLKGYLLAATGTLPPLNRGNWGEYIDLLERAGASRSVIDVLRVLKRQRNPLMHPQDTLQMEDAVNVFNLCRSGASALASDIRAKSLEAKFTAALAQLPTM